MNSKRKYIKVWGGRENEEGKRGQKNEKTESLTCKKK